MAEPKPNTVSADAQAVINANREISAASDKAMAERVAALDDSADRRAQLASREAADRAKAQLAALLAAQTTTGPLALAYNRRDVAAAVLAALAPLGLDEAEQARRALMALDVLQAVAPWPAAVSSG